MAGPIGRDLQIDFHWGIGDAVWLPVIFIGSSDPVADGFVQSLARPGGNLTGFTVLEPSIGAKLLELLKQIAPDVSRVAVLVNPDSLLSRRLVGSAADAAQKFAVEVKEVPIRGPTEIEAALATRGGATHDGLIIPADPATNSLRKLIVDLAARRELPAIVSGLFLHEGVTSIAMQPLWPLALM